MVLDKFGFPDLREYKGKVFTDLPLYIRRTGRTYQRLDSFTNYFYYGSYRLTIDPDDTIIEVDFDVGS